MRFGYAIAALLLVGCGSAESRTSITVSAAASLTGAFTEIADEFAAAHPDVDVALNFGSSGQLAAQISDGATADVAAFADTAAMDTLAKAGLVDESDVFATNELTIVTKPGNPSGVTGLADLKGVVSLCVETAPCGKFAAQVLAAAGVTIPEGSVTRGADVKATLAAVAEGDAVAAIVYVTDARAAAGRVDEVEIPAASNTVAEYPIAVVRNSTHAEAARAFRDAVVSEGGRKVLRTAGFGAP